MRLFLLIQISSVVVQIFFSQSWISHYNSFHIRNIFRPRLIQFGNEIHKPGYLAFMLISQTRNVRIENLPLIHNLSETSQFFLPAANEDCHGGEI